MLRLAGQYPLVVVTHHPQLAVRLGERLIVVADGCVRQQFERGGTDAATLGRVLARTLPEVTADSPQASPQVS